MRFLCLPFPILTLSLALSVLFCRRLPAIHSMRWWSGHDWTAIIGTEWVRTGGLDPVDRKESRRFYRSFYQSEQGHDTTRWDLTDLLCGGRTCCWCWSLSSWCPLLSCSWLSDLVSWMMRRFGIEEERQHGFPFQEEQLRIILILKWAS